MTPFHTSLIVWGTWLILFVASFLVLEVLALKDVGAWNTLTWTFRQMFARSQLFGLLFVGLTSVLVAHFFWRRAKRDEIEGDR